MKHLLAIVLVALSAAPAAARAQDPVRVGDFWLDMNVDPMTDESRALLIVEAAESTAFQPALFGWACTDAGLEVAFSPGRYLGRDAATVQFRFDRDPASRPDVWQPGKDRRFTFLPVEETEGFTRRAMGAARLVVRAWDSMDNVYTHTFSMMGLTRGLRRLPCAVWLFQEG